MNNERGSLLADLLVGLLLTAFVAQATVLTLSTTTQIHTQQDITANLEQNLRLGMRVLSDTLRAAGYGAPTAQLQAWVPWVSGFNSNPTILDGPPATISVARCTPLPVAVLTASAARGSTALSIENQVRWAPLSLLLDNGNKRLIQIGENEFAHITRISDTTLTVDTDLSTTGDQGISRYYPVGTPICRVDVLTFAIDAAETVLELDENQGGGSQALADDISNIEITTIAPGRYEIEMTALSKEIDPVTGTKLTRTLRSDITLRNPL